MTHRRTDRQTTSGVDRDSKILPSDSIQFDSPCLLYATPRIKHIEYRLKRSTSPVERFDAPLRSFISFLLLFSLFFSFFFFLRGGVRNEVSTKLLITLTSNRPRLMLEISSKKFNRWILRNCQRVEGLTSIRER